MKMQTITVTMTLQEAKNACMIMSKADPLGVFTGELLRRIDGAGQKAFELSVKDAEKEGQTKPTFGKIVETTKGA
jgi:hypothetical protein